MYSELTISTIAERIKWNDSLDSAFAVELSEDNQKGTSSKHFQSFHNLVSIDNIYAAVPEIDMDAEDFNNYLTDIRLQATLQALNDILETNENYDPVKDYSEVLISNAALFDNAIGYKVAINVLELYLSTSRSNFTERNAKLSASNLKLELEGFVNENGVMVAKGIKYYYQNAIKKAVEKLFPFEIIIKSSNNLW